MHLSEFCITIFHRPPIDVCSSILETATGDVPYKNESENFCISHRETRASGYILLIKLQASVGNIIKKETLARFLFLRIMQNF